MRSARRLFDLPLLMAAAATVAASAAALMSKVWWGIELFSHFRVQYLAAALLLTLVLLTQRRLRWCFVLGTCAVLNAVPLIPYLPVGRPAIAGDAAQPLKIMSVNVQRSNDRHERLLDIIAAESPDVLVVVELTDAWEERLRPLYRHYPHHVLRPQNDAFGIALLSRHELGSVEIHELGTTPAIEARALTPAGPLRVIGVHLRPPTTQASAAERNRQLQLLAALAEPAAEPVAVTGDFNITPYSPYFADWLIETGFKDARSGLGPGFSWPTFLPLMGIPIDHCIVSPDVTVADFRRLPRFGSDHYPVLAELIL